MTATIIPVADTLASGAKSHEIVASSAVAAHVQLNIGTATYVSVEGVVTDPDDRITEIPDDQWTEFTRLYSTDIHKMKYLPPLYRFRAVGGATGRIAVAHYQELSMVPDIAPTTVGEIEGVVNGMVSATIEKADRAVNALSHLTIGTLSLRPQAAGPQWANGDRWLWNASSPLPGGIADGARVVAALDSGYWVREQPITVWHADWYAERCITQHAADWGACLTFIASLMATGDTLRMSPRLYYTTSTFTAPRAISWDCEGAVLDVDHDGMALDINPGATGRTGDTYPEQRGHIGTLPGVRQRDARGFAAGSVGIRLVNAYWPRLQLQEVQGFQVGLRLYAQGAAAAGADRGTSYARIELGRMLNFSNIEISMEANSGGALNYVTEIVFLGGSLVGYSPALKHVVIPAGTAPVIDKIHFEGTSFEGGPGMVFDLNAGEFITADRCRLEINMTNISSVVNFGAGVSCCDLELNGLNANDRFLYITQGAGARWNVLRDNKYPYGPVRWVDGILTILGKKFDGYPAPTVNWHPERLDLQRVLDLAAVDVNAPATRTMDLKSDRRWNITTTGDGAVPANLVSWANEPDGDYEVEVTLIQSGNHTSINAGWLPGVTFGEFPQPAPNRLYKRDTYRIRRINGFRFVVAHFAQP